MSSIIPLESNPDVLNKYLQVLGVSDKWNLVDVYGLDSDALDWIPKPVLSVILLFPCNEKYYQHAEIQCKEIKEKGQHLVPGIYYMKQIVSNACGTVALIHSIANNLDKIDLADGPFKKLLVDSSSMSPEERAELLQKFDDPLMVAHQELALEGQTEANPNDGSNYHFVSFVEKDGFLFELDGRKEFPINHGSTTSDTILEDSARVCRDYISRESDDINFTVMALAKADR